MWYDVKLCWGLVVLPQLDDCTKAVGTTLNQSGPTNQFTVPFGSAMASPAERFLLPCVHHFYLTLYVNLLPLLLY